MIIYLRIILIAIILLEVHILKLIILDILWWFLPRALLVRGKTLPRKMKSWRNDCMNNSQMFMFNARSQMLWSEWLKHVHNNACKVEWIIFTQSQLNAVSTNNEGYIKESRLNILVPESFVYEKQRKVDILFLFYFTLTDIVSFKYVYNFRPHLLFSSDKLIGDVTDKNGKITAPSSLATAKKDFIDAEKTVENISSASAIRADSEKVVEETTNPSAVQVDGEKIVEKH